MHHFQLGKNMHERFISKIIKIGISLPVTLTLFSVYNDTSVFHNVINETRNAKLATSRRMKGSVDCVENKGSQYV